jgi:hypothetical protein
MAFFGIQAFNVTVDVDNVRTRAATHMHNNWVETQSACDNGEQKSGPSYSLGSLGTA